MDDMDDEKSSKPPPNAALAVFLVTVMSACVWMTLSLLAHYHDCGEGSFNELLIVSEVTLGGIIWLPGLLFGLPLVASLRASASRWMLVTIVFVGIMVVTYFIEAKLYPVPAAPRLCAIQF